MKVRILKGCFIARQKVMPVQMVPGKTKEDPEQEVETIVDVDKKLVGRELVSSGKAEVVTDAKVPVTLKLKDEKEIIEELEAAREEKAAQLKALKD